MLQNQQEKTLQNRLKHKFHQNRSGICTSQVLIIEAFTSWEFDFVACMNVLSRSKSELSTEGS